jgi:16S rRNA processing protein RimM
MVVMGHVGAPFGVKGWVKIHPYTEALESLLDYPSWWLGHEEQGDWRRGAVAEARVHAKLLVVRLEGCSDREAALKHRGLQVAVRRDEMPESVPGEFYWVDLVGLTAINLEGVKLGTVEALIETGANRVLQVRGDRERLIPFVETVVREVDLEAGRIRVDWGADY